MYTFIIIIFFFSPLVSIESFYDFVFHSRRCFCNRPITKSRVFFFHSFFISMCIDGIFLFWLFIIRVGIQYYYYIRLPSSHSSMMIRTKTRWKKKYVYNCLIIMLNYTAAAVGAEWNRNAVVCVIAAAARIPIGRPSVGGPFSMRLIDSNASNSRNDDS